MADGRHVRKKIGNAITRLPMDRLGWNLVGRIQPQHLHRKTVSLVLVITAIPHSEHNGFMGFIDQKYPQTKNTFCRTRSLSNATFSLLITWRSSSSKSAAVYKISSKSDDFSLRCGDFQNGGCPPSWNCFTTIRDHLSKSLLLLPVKFHANLLIWLEMPIRAPTMGGWGTLDP